MVGNRDGCFWLLELEPELLLVLLPLVLVATIVVIDFINGSPIIILSSPRPKQVGC